MVKVVSSFILFIMMLVFVVRILCAINICSKYYLIESRSSAMALCEIFHEEIFEVGSHGDDPFLYPHGYQNKTFIDDQVSSITKKTKAKTT